MKDTEKLIWTSAFSAAIMYEYNFIRIHGGDSEEICGFSCAEIADLAVEKYREALEHEDAKCLLPIRENQEK